MIHSDEMYLEQREADFLNDPESNYAELKQREEQFQQEYDSLPVIDMNSLKPSDYTESIQVSEEKKELVNVTSLDLSRQIINAITSGHIDPLEFAVKKKVIIDGLELAMKNEAVKSLICDEVEKSGKEGATRLGAKISLRGTKRYQYAADPTWNALSESIKPVQEKMKEQEKRVQAACKNNCSLIDSDTGEIIASIVPAPETTSITVSFSKKK